MSDIKKTNAMRMLDKAGITYEAKEYEYDENDLDGHHVAKYLSIPYEEVYKTLVGRNDKGELLVFVLSVDDELDLKKAARASGSKRIELLPVKELLPNTGYIRGGCSPIGMRKKLRTFIDEMILLVDSCHVSAGERGIQLKLSPDDLIDFVEGTVTDLAFRA